MGHQMFKIGLKIRQTSLAHSGHLLEQLKVAADRPIIPLSEVLPGLAHRVTQPETPQHLLDSPGPSHLQIQVLDRLKARHPPCQDILHPIKPQLTSALGLPRQAPNHGQLLDPVGLVPADPQDLADPPGPNTPASDQSPSAQSTGYISRPRALARFASHASGTAPLAPGRLGWS